MAMAHNNSASKLIRIRHTRSSQKHLEQVRDIMDNINAEFEATADQFRFLANKSFNQADINRYVKTLVGVEKTPDEDIKTRTRNILDDILSRIEGPKQSAANVRGTWWAAYNGYNEYLNYAKGRTNDNRIDSLWFGQGANDNSKSLNLALEFANAI
jgi:hypothetical protein